MSPGNYLFCFGTIANEAMKCIFENKKEILWGYECAKTNILRELVLCFCVNYVWILTKKTSKLKRFTSFINRTNLPIRKKKHYFTKQSISPSTDLNFLEKLENIIRIILIPGVIRIGVRNEAHGVFPCKDLMLVSDCMK